MSDCYAMTDERTWWKQKADTIQPVLLLYVRSCR